VDLPASHEHPAAETARLVGHAKASSRSEI